MTDNDKSLDELRDELFPYKQVVQVNDNLAYRAYVGAAREGWDICRIEMDKRQKEIDKRQAAKDDAVKGLVEAYKDLLHELIGAKEDPDEQEEMSVSLQYKIIESKQALAKYFETIGEKK